MTQELKDFEKLIKKQHDELRKIYFPSGTTCFRVYDRQMGAFPLIVERYGEYLRIEAEEQLLPADLEQAADSASRMAYVPPERVVINQRKRVRGGEKPPETQEKGEKIIVQEMGLSYYADLTSYRDTGLFLDHAVTRDTVREHAQGVRVLNLFSYTGGFTVAAAAGGAAETVSVDLSNTYLRWMEENLELNGLSAPVHKSVRQDALAFLASPPQDAGKFHIIVLDPPTFSNSSSMDAPFRIQKDHPWCISRCLDLLTDDGLLLFASNYASFKLNKKQLPRCISEEITREMVPPGFTVKRFPHKSWMIRKVRKSSS